MSGPHPGPGRETHQSGCPLTPGRDLAASRHHDHRIGLNMSASSLKHASMYGFTKTEHSSSSSSSSYSPLRRLQHLTSMVSQPDLVLPVREPERSWEWGGNKKERGKEMETDSWADCTSGDYSGSQNTSREESYCGSSSGPKQPVVQSRSRDIPAAPDVSEKKTEGLFSGPPSPAFSLDSNSPFANGFLHFESSLFEDDDEEQDAVSPLDRGLDKHDRPENLIPSTPGNVNSDSKDATLSSAKVVTRSQSSGQRRRYWDGSDDEWESGSELLLLDDSPTRHSMNSFKKKAVPSLKFLEGEVIWAKLNRRPWWPCEVTVDPAQGIYHKVKEPSDRPSRLYHVRTFGEPLELTWVEEKSTHSFHGGFEFDQLPLLRRKGKQREQNYKNTIAKRLQDSWKSSVAEAEFVVQARHQMSSSFPSFIDDDFQDSFSPETERKANPTFTPSTSPTLPETFYMTNGSISPPITTPAKPSTLNKSSGKKQPSKSSKDSCSKHSKKSKTLRNSPDQSERDNGECPYSDIDSVPKILCPKALERQSKLTTTQPLVTIVKEVKKQPEIQTGLWFTKSGKDRRPKTTSSKSDRTLFSKVPCKKKNSFAASKKSLLPTSFSTSSEQLGFSDRHKTPGETKLSPEQPVHLKCKNTVIAKKPFVTTSSTPYKSSLSDNRKTLEPAESNLITEQPQHLKFKNTLVANTSLGTTASPTEHSWFSEKHNTLVPAETNLQHKQPGHFKCFNTKVANRPFSTSVSTNDLSGLSDKQSSLVFDKLDVPFDKCRYSKDRKTDCNTIEPVTVLPLDQLGRSHVKKNIKPSPLIFNDQSMLSVKTVSQTPHSDTMANYKVHPIDRISDQAEEKQRKKLSVKKFSKTQHSDPMASKTVQVIDWIEEKESEKLNVKTFSETQHSETTASKKVHVIDKISDQAEEKQRKKLSVKKYSKTQQSDPIAGKTVQVIDWISDQSEEKESQKLSAKRVIQTQHSDSTACKKVHEMDRICVQAKEKESKMLSGKRGSQAQHSDSMDNKKVHEIDRICDQAKEKRGKKLSKKEANPTVHSEPMVTKKVHVIDSISDQAEEKESQKLSKKKANPTQHSDTMVNKKVHEIDSISDQAEEKESQKLSKKKANPTQHSDTMVNKKVHEIDSISDQAEEKESKMLSKKRARLTLHSDTVVNKKVHEIDSISEQAAEKESKRLSKKRASLTQHSNTMADKKYTVVDGMSDQSEEKESKTLRVKTVRQNPHSDMLATKNIHAIDRVSDQRGDKQIQKLSVKSFSRTKHSDRMSDEIVHVVERMSDRSEEMKIKKLSAKIVSHTQRSDLVASQEVQAIDRVSDQAEKKERKQSSVKRVSQTEDSDTKTDKKVQVIDRVSDQAEKKERKQCATRISHSQHSDLVASQEVQAIDRVSDQSEEKERKKLIVKRVSQTEDSDTLANKKVQVIDKVSDQAEGKERKRLSAKKIIHTQHSETEANNKVEVIERVSDMAEENTSSARLNVDAFDPIARLEMQTSLLSKCRLPFVKLIRKDMKGKKFLNSTVTLNPNDQPGCTKDEIPDAEVPEMSSKQSDWVNGKASISIDRAVSSESIKISVKKVKASGGTGVLRLSSESLHDKPIVTSKVANVLDELGSQESERVPVLNVSNMTYSLSNQSEGRKTLASNESSMTTDQLGNSEQKMTSANSTAFDKTPSSVKAKKVVSKLKLVSDEVNRIVLHEQPTHLPASGRLMTRALKAMQEVEETKREKVRKKAEHKELLNLYKTTEHVACNSASNSKLDFCTEIKTRTDNDFDQDTSSSSTSPLTRPDSADLDVKSEDEDLSISSTPPMDFIPLTSRVKAKNEDQSSDMQRSSSAPSSPFSFINSFKNIEEVSFQSLTNEGEGKPISFKADTSYKFSTFLMMLKDLHDTREREGTPLELDIGPPSAHVKEEPLVMPGEATSAGQDPQIKQVKNDSNSSPDKVENKHNEGSTSQTSKRPYKRRISSTRVKKKANREVPCRPARSGPGFPGLESLPTTDSSSGLDCSSRDKSLFGIEASSWERHAGGAEGVVGEEDDTWSRVNENLQNMVPLEQRGCDTTLCLEQPNGLVADGTETTTSFMRDTGGSDKAPKAHKRIRKPSKRLIEWTEEYDQIFSTRKKIKKPLQLIGKETQPVMSEHPGSDSSSQDDHPSLNLPPEIQTPPPEEIPTTTPSALQIPNTENTSTQDAPVLSIDTLTPPPEADHLLSEGLVKGNGSAPVLERKRKRKPTQKILEYCMEAEASAGPKKKVKTLKNNSNPAPQSDAGPPSLKSKTRQPTASSSTEVSSSSTTDPPPKSPAPSPPAPPSPEPTLEETPSADIDAPQAEDKKESTESEAEPSCLDQASPP
ncbi:microtubule-associated protein futsch-like isoform X2 [Notothenia coriiceps]|uniref:Microtubule-associated protein futsch-like isoform X2 n=1 Tax=Notothenia coriiceps TaxID=8208 RepID=A0A6I9N164_9TELE|nr:PREDICTED: microtubule-associated protein futsch-like isoform X2 [Notothenia coriiceps]